MGQSLLSGVLGGVGGAVSGFFRGGATGALVLGTVGFVGGFASTYLAKQATADALSSAMGPTPSPLASVAEPKFGGYTVNRRGSALHHQVIYGETRVGGAIVFDDAHGADGLPNTDDNKYLSRIIAFAGHEIDSFQQVYMGKYSLSISGDNVTSAQEIDETGAAVGGPTTKFNNYIKIRRVLGNHSTSLNGTAPTNFSNKWTANHKLLGIAHLAIVFEYADNVWEEGLPEISALIRGKRVYDPRTSTTAWSDNPALIVRDFLTDSGYGLGEAVANIDDTLISTAANVCEETVTDGDRYTCNGAWLTSQAPVDVISQLMTSCAGYLWYAQGKWRLKAGDYIAPTVTLTEDDLRSPLSVSTRHSRRDNFNAVRGTFRGPATNYQFTDYPTVTSSTFVTVDGGLESSMDLALPFTNTPEQAQRIAAIALEKNRSQITVSGSFGLNAFSLQVGDNVNITNSRFGWTNKLFEVVAWGLSAEGMQLQVNLVLRETTTTTYDEFLNPTGFESDNTNLPGALGQVTTGAGDVVSTTEVTGLTASGGIRQNSVSWTNPVNNNYDYTKIWFDTNNTISGASTINITGESWVHTGLGANDTRYYWAQPFNSSNVALGAQIGPVSATTKRADTDDIVGGAITTDKIYDLAVTTAKIADADITTAKIANLNVTAAKIADASITSGKLIQGGYVGVGNYIPFGPNSSSNSSFSQSFGASANGDAFVLVIAKLVVFGSSSSSSDISASLVVDGTNVDSFSLTNVPEGVFVTQSLIGGKSNVSGGFSVSLGWNGVNITNDSYYGRMIVWRFYN